ncbi:MAG TPA: hypothetical protein VLL08_20455, partial [Kineosporiaceae bacterium]|nr:hypothetical protein [Kineosporiaceae bacterium]
MCDLASVNPPTEGIALSTVAGVSIPKNADDWRSVEIFQDFVALLRLLSLDWDEDEAKRLSRAAQGLWAGEGESWAQGTPGAWMEATHSWLTTDAAADPDLKEPSWRTFAHILASGR